MACLKRILQVVASSLLGAICLSFAQPASAVGTEEGTYFGYISGRGIVVDDQGYATWVKYGPSVTYQNVVLHDEYGNLSKGPFTIPGLPVEERTASGEFLNAVVISYDEFVFHKSTYHDITTKTTAVGTWQLLTRAEFSTRTFRDTSGTVVDASLANQATRFVLVRSGAALTPGVPVVLAEFPFDPTVHDLPNTTKSVLISTQPGSEGKVILWGDGPIAYKVDFITPQTLDEQTADTGLTNSQGERFTYLGICEESTQTDGALKISKALDGQPVTLDNVSYVDVSLEDATNRFLKCSPHRIAKTASGRPKVWGPLMGAYITNGISEYWGGSRSATTDNNGYYRLLYLYQAGTTSWDDLHVVLNFAPQNPLVPFGSRYLYKRVVQGGATFELSTSGRASTINGVVESSVRDTDANVGTGGLSGPITDDRPLLGAMESSPEVSSYLGWMTGTLVDTRDPRGYNIPIDLAYVLGDVSLKNERRSEVELDPEVANHLDITIDDVNNRTQYSYVKPVYPPMSIQQRVDPASGATYDRYVASSTGGTTSTTTTAAAGAAILSEMVDRGLVTQISRADLNKTDLFIFTPDGQLGGTRIGLRVNETHGLQCEGAPTAPFTRPTALCQNNEGGWCTKCTLAAPGADPYPALFHLQTFVNTNQPGTRYGILLVNRATGYIGTGYVKMTDDEALKLAGGQLPSSWQPSNGLNARPIFSTSRTGEVSGITMRPPNLTIKGKRCPAGTQCAPAETKNERVIGFEGAGLDSDNYIALESQFLDWDGSPLPTLPEQYGYTGRIAKVALSPSSAGPASLNTLSEVVHFTIPLNSQKTQWIRVPDSVVNNYHYYVHVTGETNTDCQGGSNVCHGFTEVLSEGALRHRPNNYVPIKVPVYDASATTGALQAAAALAVQSGQAAMGKVDPIYTSVYRPEYQFSIFDLPPIENAQVLTEYNASTNTSASTLTFTYSLTSAYGLSSLPTLGTDNQLLWGVGYNELLATLGKDVVKSVPNLEQLLTMTPGGQLNTVANIASSLTAADYLGLQLYTANDRGNALYENYTLPVFSATAAPIRLERRINSSSFATGIANPNNIEDYRAIPFAVTMDAKVRLYAEIPGGRTISIFEDPLVPAGQHYFILDTATLADLTLQGLPSEFTAVLEGTALDNPAGTATSVTPIPHRVKYPVVFNTRRSGEMLGQILEHDVNILDGALHLTRTDFSIEGLGPNLALQRSYNSNNGSGGVLGPGWSHSYELELTPIETSDYSGGSVPPWLAELRRFPFPVASAVDPHLYSTEGTSISAISVNGGTFRKDAGGQWVSETGRHGRLVELQQRCSEADAANSHCYVFIAPDLTEYRYPVPVAVAPTPPSLGTDRTMVSVADGLAMRAGLEPASLLTGATAQVTAGVKASGYQPVKVRSITDRFGNRSTFTYDGSRLLQVSDAVARSCEFEYDPRPQCTAFDGPECNRLSKITCLRGAVSPDGRSVELTVNYRYKNGRLFSVQHGRRREEYTYVDGSGPGSGADSNLTTVAKYLEGVVPGDGATEPSGGRKAVTTYSYRVPADGQRTFTPLPGREPIPLYEMVESVAYPPTVGDGDAALALNVNFAYPTMNQRQLSGGIPKSYTLNAVGNPTSIVEGSGTKRRTTSLTWSVDGGAGTGCPEVPNQALHDNVLLARTVDRGDKTLATSFSYDTMGRVTAECGPGPRRVIQTWTNFGELETRKDWRNRNTEQWHYTALSQSTANYVTGGGQVLGNYVDGAGVVTTYSPSLSARGRIETATVVGSNPPRVTHYGYDGWGNQTTTTVGPTLVTERTLDARGRPVYVYDALRRRTHNAYTDNDELDYVELPTVTPQALGSPFSTPIAAFLEYDYDDAGNRTLETDRSNQQLAHTYTLLGQVQQTRRIGSALVPEAVKQIRYDVLGNVTMEEDWQQHQTHYTYDGLGYRQTTSSRIATNGNTITDHDLLGNVTLITDFEGRRTRIDYTDLNTEWHRQIVDCSEGDCGLPEVTSEPTPVASHEEPSVVYTVTKTNATPQTTTLGYDGMDRLVFRQNPDGGKHIWRFDPSGALSEEVNEEGVSTQHIYNESGYEVRTEVHGRNNDGVIITRLTPDDKGNVTQTIVTNDSGDVTTTLTYDEWDRLATRSVSPVSPQETAANTERFNYDGKGNPVASRDAGGRTRFWERDQLGQVRTYLDAETQAGPQTRDYTGACAHHPVNFTSCNDYYPNGTLLRTVDARGVETSFLYDAEDRELSRTQTARGASGDPLIRSAYVRDRDRMGNPTEIEDFRGHRQVLTYTDRYLLKSKTDALGRTTSYTYWPSRKVHTESTPAPGSFTRTYTYDSMDRVHEVTYTTQGGQLLTESHHDYDHLGNVTTAQNVSGGLTENFYDAFVRHEDTYVTSSAKGRIHIAHNEYDDQGNLTAVTDAANHRIVYHYTARNLQWQVLYPDGQMVTRSFYPSGKVWTETQPGNYTTTFGYDAEDRLLSSTIDGETTSFTYDLLGQRKSETQPEGQSGGKYEGRSKIYSYDGFGRLSEVTDEVNIATRYDYDLNDNLTDQYGPEDPNVTGAQPHVHYDYDDINRRTAATRDLGNGATATTEYLDFDTLNNPETVRRPLFAVSYDYDQYSRVVSMSLPTNANPTYQIASVTRNYNDATKTVVTTQTKLDPQGVGQTDVTTDVRDRALDWLLSSTQRGTTIGFDYHLTGARSQVSSPSGVTNYTYDSRNRLDTATLGTALVDYVYDDDARTLTLDYPNETSVVYQYGAAGRVASITHTFADSATTVVAYEYDHNGNPTRVTDTVDGISDVTTPMVYDAAGRLHEFTQDGKTTIYTFEAYDRKTETVRQGTNSGPVQIARTYTYDQDRRLSNVSEQTPGNAAVVTYYDYDLHGNLLLRRVSNDPAATTAFFYNALDQLVRVTRGPPGSEEVLGDYDYDANGKRIRHIGDDRGNVESIYDDNAVVEETVTGGSGPTHLRFHYGTSALAMSVGATYGELSYFHQDLLHSTRHLSDSSGQRTASYKHDPWGKVREQSGDTLNRLTYTQQEKDNRTGLFYYGARFYDPQIGRFLSSDTWSGDTKNPPSLHKYLYAYSNPFRYTDPTGHESTSVNPTTENATSSQVDGCDPTKSSCVVAGASMGPAQNETPNPIVSTQPSTPSDRKPAVRQEDKTGRTDEVAKKDEPSALAQELRFSRVGFYYESMDCDPFPPLSGVETGSIPSNIAWNTFYTVHNVLTVPFNTIARANFVVESSLRWAGFNPTDIQAYRDLLVAGRMGSLVSLPRKAALTLQLAEDTTVALSELEKAAPVVQAVEQASQDANLVEKVASAAESSSVAAEARLNARFSSATDLQRGVNALHRGGFPTLNRNSQATTALLEATDAEGNVWRVVATNTGSVPARAKALAHRLYGDRLIFATPQDKAAAIAEGLGGHAEMSTAMRAARQAGLDPKVVAASREVCKTCSGNLGQLEIPTVTPSQTGPRPKYMPGSRPLYGPRSKDWSQ